MCIPAFVFAVPTIVFLAGVSFAVGEWTRRPILLFFLPVAELLICGFFLWDWSPAWLDPRINRALMLIDPSAFRWLSETWLKGDRGVHFYNTPPIPLDTGLIVSRLCFLALGTGRRRAVPAAPGHAPCEAPRSRAAVGSTLCAGAIAAVLPSPSSLRLRQRPRRTLAMRSGVPDYLAQHLADCTHRAARTAQSSRDFICSFR